MMTEDDIDDVVAFLASLTSADCKGQGIKELERQREFARTRTDPSATRREPSAGSRTSPSRPP
jgi:hypothetical protein